MYQTLTPSAETFQETVEHTYDDLVGCCTPGSYSEEPRTAAEMLRLRRGNCFTFSEATALELRENPLVGEVGIVINLMAGGSRLHASSVALS